MHRSGFARNDHIQTSRFRTFITRNGPCTASQNPGKHRILASPFSRFPQSQTHRVVNSVWPFLTFLTDLPSEKGRFLAKTLKNS